jgi:hypothetical protein
MRWTSESILIADGDVELVAGVLTPRKRGRRRCSSPRWVPPGSQIPNRYPGLGSSGLMWWKGMLGYGQVKFSSFFLSCFSFLFSYFLFYDSNSILNSIFVGFGFWI